MITVVFTDLVGSTELSSRLGPEGAEELRQTHFKLLRQAVAAHSGTEVKNLGDGLMVVFSSLSRALSCAVGMQQTLELHNRRSTENLGVRIGVSTGEAVSEDGDYFGEPVVQAARLCAKAQGGQILAPGLVVQLGGRRSGQGFSPVGDLRLKGLPEPVATVEVTWAPLREASDDPGVPLHVRLATRPGVGYVGRVEERRLLADAFKSAAAGDGREVILISGEPGIGKSSLAAEAARSAVEVGAIALYGRCDEDLGLPYQPLAEALSHYVTYAPQALLVEHVRDHGGELAHLVPALRRRIPELPPPASTDADTGRYLLFAAVTGLLTAATQAMPLVLVLDDLQWADKPSLLLLKLLASTLETQRFVIIGTYRDSDLHRSHPLLDTLAALRREARTHRINLSGLSDRDVVAVMEGAAGHQMDQDGIGLAHAISRETGGNPFFVSETLQHLAESGWIYRDTGGRWVTNQGLEVAGLPQSVREVVGARVARLGELVKQVLTGASVIGEHFDLDLLPHLVDLSEDELLDALDQAVRARVITEVDHAGRYRFAHALIQHTLYQDLGGVRRSRAHRRVAVALEELCGDDPGARVAELAHHWARATQGVDLAKVVRYSRLAGQRALDQLAPDEALRWFNQALQLFEQQNADDEALRTDLLIGLGTAQRQAGDPAHRETLLEAAQQARRIGDTERLIVAALANNRGYFSAVGQLDTERIAVLEATLDAISAGGDRPEHARVLATLAVELSAEGDSLPHRGPADQALAMARRLDDPASLAQVLILRFLAINVPETLDMRLAETAEACSLTEEIRDPAAQFIAIMFRAWACIQAGDLDEVDRRFGQMSELAHQLSQPFVDHWTAFYQSWRALLGGDLERSEALATKALQVANAMDNPDGRMFYAGQLFAVRQAQGRLAELAETVATVAAANPGVPVLRATWATTLCELDRDEEARQLLVAESAGGFAAHPRNFEWLHAMARWANVCVHLRAAELAQVLYDHLEPFAGQVAFSGVTVGGSVSHCLGGLAGLLGRYDETERYFARATAVHEKLKSPYLLALTQLSWARVLMDRAAPGDAARAVELARLVHDASQRHGFATAGRRAAELIPPAR